MDPLPKVTTQQDDQLFTIASCLSCRQSSVCSVEKDTINEISGFALNCVWQRSRR